MGTHIPDSDLLNVGDQQALGLLVRLCGLGRGQRLLGLRLWHWLWFWAGWPGAGLRGPGKQRHCCLLRGSPRPASRVSPSEDQGEPEPKDAVRRDQCSSSSCEGTLGTPRHSGIKLPRIWHQRSDQAWSLLDAGHRPGLQSSVPSGPRVPALPQSFSPGALFLGRHYWLSCSDFTLNARIGGQVEPSHARDTVRPRGEAHTRPSPGPALPLAIPDPPPCLPPFSAPMPWSLSLGCGGFSRRPGPLTASQWHRSVLQPERGR